MCFSLNSNCLARVLTKRLSLRLLDLKKSKARLDDDSGMNVQISDMTASQIPRDRSRPNDWKVEAGFRDIAAVNFPKQKEIFRKRWTKIVSFSPVAKSKKYCRGHY